MNQKELAKKIEKYERFVDSMNTISEHYISMFPNLVNRIKELRINRANIEKVVLEVDPNSNVIDLQTLQMVKKLWRVAANLTHPDHGGDPSLFRFCRALYKGQDLRMLNGIVQALQNGTPIIINEQLEAMYELQKSKFSFQVLRLHTEGKLDECKLLTRKYLENSILALLQFDKSKTAM